MNNIEIQTTQILSKLLGGTIVGTIIDPEQEHFGFEVKKGHLTYNVWIDSDEEGNNPGSLSIEEQD